MVLPLPTRVSRLPPLPPPYHAAALDGATPQLWVVLLRRHHLLPSKLQRVLTAEGNVVERVHGRVRALKARVQLLLADVAAEMG